MDCKELLDLFLAIEDPTQAEDVNYFKCNHLLHYMDDVTKCEFPLDNTAFTKKVLLLRNLAKKGATQSLADAEKAEHEAVAYLNSKLGLNSELGLNGGSRRRRASKHSKKSRKSKSRRTKTKSRRH